MSPEQAEQPRRPALIGRGSQLRQIAESLRPESPWRGVLVYADPGLGRTRLVREVAARVDRRRTDAVWAPAARTLADVPFGALAPLLPEDVVAARSVSGAAQALLGRAGTHRLLLVVDDAQWLDPLSAALLRDLLGRQHAFVLLTMRRGEPEPDPLADLWADGRVRQVELHALSRQESEQFLRQTLGGYVSGLATERLCRTADGSPRLLDELVTAGLSAGALRERQGVWHLAGDLPMTPRLTRFVQGEVGPVRDEHCRVLELLAVGGPLGVDLLGELGRPEDVESAEAAQLVVAREDGRRYELSLRHPLHRQLLLETTPGVRLRRLRRELADALEARHLRRKGDQRLLATLLLGVGRLPPPDLIGDVTRQAWLSLDLESTSRLAGAGRHVGRQDEVGLPMASALMFRGRPKEAEEAFAEVQRRARTHERRLGAATGRAVALYFGLGRPKEARAVLAEAAGVTETGDDRAELLAWTALLDAFDDRPPEVLARTDEAATIESPSSRAAAVAGLARGMAFTRLRQHGAAAECLDAAERAADAPDGDLPWLRELVDLARHQLHLVTGDVGEARHLAQRGYRSAIRLEWPFAVVLRCLAQAQLACRRGDLRWAEHRLAEARILGESTDVGAFRVALLAEMALVHAMRGDGAAAAGFLAEADDLACSGAPVFQPALALARPFVVAAQHGPAAAVACAESMADQLADHHPAYAAQALHTLVRLGAPDRAERRLVDLAQRTGEEMIRLYAEDATASAAADAGALGRLSGRFVAAGSILLGAEAAARAAATLEAAGERSAARSWSVRAAALARRCPDARTPGLVTAHRPTLTKRETQVARMALEGLPSSEIAQRLVLSTRTVENHLQRVYRKLGTGGRTALADLLTPFLDEAGERDLGALG